MALAQYKWCTFVRDTQGRDARLHYYRDSNQREVDFVITEGSSIVACIEVKSGDDNPSPSLNYLASRIRPKLAVQLVHHCARARDYGSIKVRHLGEWLRKMELP